MSGFKVVKNSFGVSALCINKNAFLSKLGTYAGSSLTRLNPISAVTKELQKPLEPETDRVEDIGLKPRFKKPRKLRSMSPRTKQKIRAKIIAFMMVSPKLSFLTLTFCNKVSDRTAYKIFRTFMDNAKKRLPDLEYLWVIERQTENKAFEGNAHFHVINNKYWDIDKWWPYWLDTQKKYGIVPRDESFKPSSAFDVRVIKTNNLKGLVNYVTKYVTKNKGEFNCQVWNCTKKVSRLFTAFYSDGSFLETLEKLNKSGNLGGELKRVKKDWFELFLVPLNQTTIRLYECIRNYNLKFWNNPKNALAYALQTPKD